MCMKIVTTETIAELLTRAATAPRKRLNLNLHAEPSDPINRFLNGGLAETYVRPHRHRIGKWELLNVLQGRLDVVIFTSNGEVKSRFTLEGPELDRNLRWRMAQFRFPRARGRRTGGETRSIRTAVRQGVCRVGADGRRPLSNFVPNLARKRSARRGMAEKIKRAEG